MRRVIPPLRPFAVLLFGALLTCGGDEPMVAEAGEAGEDVGTMAPAAAPRIDAPTAEAPEEAVEAPIARPACPEEMVLVEGVHCYYREQICKRWDDPEGHPQRRVCAEFAEESRCIDEKHHAMRFCIDRSEYVTPGEALPEARVSWEKAKATCEKLGKRLCTNLEWEFACEGEAGSPYPYGTARSPSLCNQDRVVRDGPGAARRDLREPPHATCVSPFGARDMVGNVDEWVARPYGKAPFRSELRGGWWMTGRNRCRAATTSHGERYADRQTGFRCCRVPTSDSVR